MTARTSNYAGVLYELGISKESIQDTENIFETVPEMGMSLADPTVPYGTKCRIIDRVIPDDMKNFLKVVVRHQKIEKLKAIFADYEELCRKKANVIHAELRYVTKPDEKQLKGIRDFLCREFKADRAEVELLEDPQLIGGFVLTAGGQEYDWSLQGRFRKLEQRLTTRR